MQKSVNFYVFAKPIYLSFAKYIVVGGTQSCLAKCKVHSIKLQSRWWNRALVRSFVRILCTHAKRSPYVVVYLEISIIKSISLVGLIFERALFGTGTLFHPEFDYC
jgi:hypothetical protein